MILDLTYNALVGPHKRRDRCDSSSRTNGVSKDVNGIDFKERSSQGKSRVPGEGSAPVSFALDTAPPPGDGIAAASHRAASRRAASPLPPPQLTPNRLNYPRVP